MTPQEAINTLGFIKQLRIPVGELEELEALNLGIEALTRLRTLRQDPRRSAACPLPSETEEGQNDA